MENIITMDIRTAIRKRPAMYLGGVNMYGALNLVGEVISNSVDQFALGHATEVSIRVDQGVVTVADNGSGMPFDVPCEGESGNMGTHALTHHHNSPTAHGHAPHVHIHGTTGVGVVVANMLSSRMKYQAWRAGKLWEQQFEHGIPLGSPRIMQEGTGRGTVVSFALDSTVFEGVELTPKHLRDKFFQGSYLLPGLRLKIQDESFYASDGVADWLREQWQPSPQQIEKWDGRPIFFLRVKHEDVDIHVALAGERGRNSRWQAKQLDECRWWTWSNGGETREHGSHRDGVMDALKKMRWWPDAAALHVIMHDPKYAGPCRDQLDVPHVRPLVVSALAKPLEAFCREHQLGRFVAKRRKK